VNPIALIGKDFETVQAELGISAVEYRDVGLERSSAAEYSVSSQDGSWEIILSPQNIITTVFLFLEKGHEGVLGITADMCKKEITERLGEPQEYAAAQSIEGLGEYGAWEKYYMDAFQLHVQHKNGEFGVKQITLMASR
jgi:hypothetical protein